MVVQKYQNVFRPLKIGPVTVKNRIEVAPAVPMLATEDGFVSEALIAYTQELARSGAGVVTIGDSAIDFEYAKEHLNQLNLGDYRIVPGLSRLADCIHRHGAVASIEINHGGRFTAPLHLNGKNPIGPSAIPSNAAEQFEGDSGRRAVPVRAMTQEEIAQVITEYADAAERCAQAGFKMIMLHGGHGHLLAQFFSPLSNKRNDNYGGSFQNRIRFVKEVLAEIRRRIGPAVAIEMRVSADEMVEEGVHFDEMIRFVRAIQDRIDLVQLSYGNICEPVSAPYQIQPTYIPRGVNAHYAVEMKKHVDIPVTAIGSITMDMAEELLRDGKVDMVAMMRNFLADRRYAEKYRRGQGERVRPCIRCDSCTQATSRFYPVTCAVNPMVARETEFVEIAPAAFRKSVAVIGGGPAGLQAALTASQRGHNVVLYEKSGSLGGNLVYAAAPDFKRDMRDYLDWLIRQVREAPGIEIHMNTEAAPEMIEALEPDAVLAALGSAPFVPPVPGIERTLFAGDVDIGTAETGQRAVVVGAGLTGLETALHLGNGGKSVTVIDMLPRADFGKDCNNIAKIALFQLLDKLDVTFIGDVSLQSVEPGGAWIMDRDWKRRFIPADSVVLSTGFTPRKTEAEAFIGTAADVFFIGDCAGVANLKNAVHQGFNRAYEL